MSDGPGRFRIAVDTGGTFTDVVVSDVNAGRVAVGKSLTTYGRIADGFLRAVDRAADGIGVPGEELIRATETIVYGTTHATNAVVTGNTARTALLTTRGFADTLLLREGGRRNAFDSHAPYAPPYVPRRLTFELDERISAEGEVLTRLDEDGARRTIAGLVEHEVEAVGVALLWSVVNPVHEERIGELLGELAPDLAVSLSHRVNPVIREYRRSSATAIDASLKPLMRSHLRELRDDLTAVGFAGELMVVTSQGGVLDVDGVADRPILTVNSGPSMAPLAGAAAAPDAEVVVVGDMGGTTFDVSLVEAGEVRHTREAWIGDQFVGHLTGLSAVAVKSVGAGGGSIAWIDEGGLLRVGPQSAGSSPGPAAYGRGGERATVTDAAVALGYLDPEGFEGGFQLDAEAAREAIRTDVAGPLGLSVEAGSQAIFDVAVNHMASAIRQATLEEGVDPRGATVVAGGGAGPMIAAALASALESRRVVVPRTAGVLAAYGAHDAEIATEFTLPQFTTDATYDAEGVAAIFDQLEGRAAAFFDRFDAPADRRRLTAFVDARYPAQAWELRVALAKRPDGRPGEAEALATAFHREHERRNGIQAPDSAVEFVSWILVAAVATEDDGPLVAESAAASALEPHRVGEALFEGVVMATPRYAGLDHPPGATVGGPATIDGTTTTLIVPPGWTATVDERGGFRLEYAETGA
jgi:N-methylhydantoinase A